MDIRPEQHIMVPQAEPFLSMPKTSQPVQEILPETQPLTDDHLSGDHHTNINTVTAGKANSQYQFIEVNSHESEFFKGIIDKLPAKGYVKKYQSLQNEIVSKFQNIDPQNKVVYKELLESNLDVSNFVLDLLLKADTERINQLLSITSSQGDNFARQFHEFSDRTNLSILFSLTEVLIEPEKINDAYAIPHGTLEMVRDQPDQFMQLMNSAQVNTTAGLNKSNLSKSEIKEKLAPTLALLRQIEPDGVKAAEFIENLSESKLELTDKPLTAWLGCCDFPHVAAWATVKESWQPWTVKQALILNDTFWGYTDGEKVSALYHEYIHTTQPTGLGTEGDAYRKQVASALEGAPLYINRGNLHTNVSESMEIYDISSEKVGLFKQLDSAGLWSNSQDYRAMRDLAKQMQPMQKAEAIKYLMNQDPTMPEQEKLIRHILEDTTHDNHQFLKTMLELDMELLAQEVERAEDAAIILAKLFDAYENANQPVGYLFDQFIIQLSAEHREGTIDNYIKQNPSQFTEINPETLKTIINNLLNGHTDGSEENMIYNLLMDMSWEQFTNVATQPYLDTVKNEVSSKQFKSIQQRFWDMADYLRSKHG